MWGKSKKVSAQIHTLVGKDTRIVGDVHFSGGLQVEGTIKGNVIAEEGSASVLTVSEHGRVEGEVRVPNVVLNGAVQGNVYATERIELAAQARVTGNVVYSLIEMAMGAEVNGSLVHKADAHAEAPATPAPAKQVADAHARSEPNEPVAPKLKAADNS